MGRWGDGEMGRWGDGENGEIGPPPNASQEWNMGEKPLIKYVYSPEISI
ncbi:MAG: hypothetical protein F6K23_09220 [Okeania sp. SIO2C9]|nr:hypothetical protein [Okeania sp. SIO2C9]NEQ73241.1 hypothetical protein [Okeania sp. SIO2C9]